MEYPEAINLPFNSNVIRESYFPLKPGEEETVEPGFWVIVMDDYVVFRKSGEELSLFEGELPEFLKESGETVSLGRWKDRPLRLLRIDSDIELPPGFAGELLLLLFLRESIDDELLTVTGLAQQIAKWERNSLRCPCCGGNTARIAGTWGRSASTAGTIISRMSIRAQ